MKNGELWSLSGYIQKESLFQAQIKSVGISKTKYMERYQKNYVGTKRSSLYLNITTSLFLLFYAILPIGSLITIGSTNVSLGNIQDLIFSNSVIFGAFYLINFVYYFLIGFLSMVEFLQGSTFKYLRTLPLTSNDIRKITIFTVIRMNGMQVLVIVFAVPLGIMALFKNMLLAGVVLAINIINAIFIFYLFIALSDYLSRKVFNNKKSSRLYTLLRISINILYILAMLSISFVFRFITLLSQSNILTTYLGPNQTTNANLIASLMFFPVSSGYLISLFVFPKYIPSEIITGSLIGFTIFLVITYALFRKGNKIISALSLEETEAFKEAKVAVDPETIKIKVSKPKVAYIKRIFILATREQNKLAMFLLPIFFPIITAFSLRTTSDGLPIDPFIGLILYYFIIPIFLINALIEAEEGIGGLISTLPIKNRDIFRSKQYIMIFLFLISVFIYLLIIGPTQALKYSDSLIKVLSLSIAIPIISLLLYSIMFGKINKRFTLYKVNTSYTTLKYIILISFQIITVVFVLGVFNLLYSNYNIQAISFTYFLIIGNLLFLVILEILTRIIIRG